VLSQRRTAKCKVGSVELGCSIDYRVHRTWILRVSHGVSGSVRRVPIQA